MKKKGDPIDGVLLFDKPEGLSSNAAMQIVRRLANAQKAGHTGTLDPMATGLLPLCFGNATKYSADLLNAEKGTKPACSSEQKPIRVTARAPSHKRSMRRV